MVSALFTLSTLFGAVFSTATPGGPAAEAVAGTDHALHACVDAAADTAEIADPVETDPEDDLWVDDPLPSSRPAPRVTAADGHDAVATAWRRCRPARGPPAC